MSPGGVMVQVMRERISMFGGPILCPCGCGNEVASEEEFYSDECQIGKE
jgi:hypothetical protein